MDKDVFSKVSRLGRDAGDALVRAVRGEPFEKFLPCRVVDRVISIEGGISIWPTVKEEFERLESAPLLADAMRAETINRIDLIARSGGGELDKLLRNVAQSALLGGVYQPRIVMTRFVAAVLDRAILSPRGGCAQRLSFAERQHAKDLLRPIAARAATKLVERPDARKLGLARPHNPKLKAHDNLLGGK